jgi:hypothetical protein
MYSYQSNTKHQTCHNKNQAITHNLQQTKTQIQNTKSKSQHLFPSPSTIGTLSHIDFNG